MAKVMTWNVWDIPVSQFRETRMEGIAKVLRENKDNIDLVGLMECWLEKVSIEVWLVGLGLTEVFV